MQACFWRGGVYFSTKNTKFSAKTASFLEEKLTETVEPQEMLKYRLRNPPNFSDSEVCKITTEFIQKNGVKWPPEKLSLVYERCFLGGSRIERSHELFTLKNSVFCFKIQFLHRISGLAELPSIRASSALGGRGRRLWEK